MRARVQFAGIGFYPGARERWCQMLRAIGVPPEDVPETGWAEYDTEAQTVTVLTVVRNERGQCLPDPSDLYRLLRVPRVVRVEPHALEAVRAIENGGGG